MIISLLIANSFSKFLAFFFRVAEILISVILLILSLPICALIALIIRLESPGPVIFNQARVGRNRKLFTFYKFRTMLVDAKERFPELYKYDYSVEELETMYFKIVDDPRLTRVGMILRTTTLDELPNLINLLKGNLSIIGPRPDIPEMLKYYKPWQMIKFDVKPGITGLAQTRGRGLLRFQETLKHDVYYAKHKNLLLDLRILFDTVKVTIFRIGAF